MSLRMFLRVLAIVAVASGEALRTLPASLVLRVTRGPEAAADRRYRGMVRALQRLGPTFVKFGQIAGTRRDALPPALCARLGTLFDEVPPMSAAAAGEALRRATAEQPRLVLRSVDPEPLASGSIASVYRAVLD
ncbi:AarF/UbiB family protein, partial [Micromonospora chersina]